MTQFADFINSVTLDDIRRRHAEVYRSGKKFALFGAGQVGRNTSIKLRERGFDAACFIDTNKAGQTVDGLPVISPEELAARQDKYIVLLTAGSLFCDPSQVEKYGIRNYHILSETTIYSDLLTDEELSALKVKTVEVYNALADDKSRDVYRHALGHLLLLEYDHEWVERNGEREAIFRGLPAGGQRGILRCRRVRRRHPPGLRPSHRRQIRGILCY